VENYPFFLIVGLLPGDYLADWHDEVKKTLALVLLFALVTVLYGLAMRRVWKRREDDSRRLLNISQTALGHSEGQFRQLAEAMPQIAFVTTPDGNREYVNTRWRDYVGEPLQAALGKGWLGSVHPDDREGIESKWQRGLATGELVEGEYRVKSTHGDYRWHLCRALPMRDGAGKVVQWVGTSTDIDDAKRLQEKLASDDRKKDEFIATLAHELRNPLAPIRNALHIMRLSTERHVQDESRNMIERQVEHLIRLVDDLFDMSRITRGRMSLHLLRVEFRSVLQDAIAASRLRIEKQKQHFSFDLAPGSMLINGDATRLAQVVSNLLNNASRYTPEGGHISMSASCEGSQVVLAVRDDGIGIRSEMLSSIFEMFTQGERLSNRQGGMGIGLTLVKQIVEMHGGTVEAKSAGLGKGAEFVVRLPILVPERRQSTRTTEPIANAPTGRKRVLVVDDNSDSVSSLATMLRLMGHETAVASDGVEALSVAESFRPEMIFLDIGLPKKNGHEVARAIRALPWGADVVLIALSGWGQPEDLRRSIEAGFDHHFAKPARQEDIEKLLYPVEQMRDKNPHVPETKRT
jgi:two-component system CheB/CheR fusion protein